MGLTSDEMFRKRRDHSRSCEPPIYRRMAYCGLLDLLLHLRCGHSHHQYSIRRGNARSMTHLVASPVARSWTPQATTDPYSHNCRQSSYLTVS